MSATRSRWSSPKALFAARDAAELIEVDYETLPATVETALASKPGSPSCRGAWQCCLRLGARRCHGGRRATAVARHRVALDLINNRIIVNSMEPRGALGEYDPATKPILYGARPKARISCAPVRRKCVQESRKTASASSPAMSAAGSA